MAEGNGTNTNGYNAERVKECVERIENLERDRLSAHGSYMEEAKRIAEDKTAVYEEAKTAWNIPKKALKAVVKARATERKLEAIRGDLDGDIQDSFDAIRLALGDLNDTPLGAAAQEQAKTRKKAKGEALDALTH